MESRRSTSFLRFSTWKLSHVSSSTIFVDVEEEDAALSSKVKEEREKKMSDDEEDEEEEEENFLYGYEKVRGESK